MELLSSILPSNYVELFHEPQVEITNIQIINQIDALLSNIRNNNKLTKTKCDNLYFIMHKLDFLLVALKFLEDEEIFCSNKMFNDDEKLLKHLKSIKEINHDEEDWKKKPIDKFVNKWIENIETWNIISCKMVRKNVGKMIIELLILFRTIDE